jgi:hypothetical protein
MQKDFTVKYAYEKWQKITHLIQRLLQKVNCYKIQNYILDSADAN